MGMHRGQRALAANSKEDKGFDVLKTLNALNNLTRTILSLAILVVLVGAGWFAYTFYFADKLQAAKALEERDAQIAGLNQDLKARQQQIERLGEELTESHEQIDRLEVDLEAKKQEIERLDTALRLLKVDHRVAQIDVVSQQGSAENGDLVTHITFAEVDDQGNPLEKPRLFSVKGDLVYVDSWVAKFTDDYVEMGDPLRSTSICLFRRLFGEAQTPLDGFVLDPVGSQPAAYRNGGKMSELEEEIWSRLWEYANDPDQAEKVGVRAVHGEAPYVKVLPGKRYKVLLRSSGGLSFAPPEDLPPDAKPAPPAETL
jgi:Tfp pilus assembly protein PilO